MQLSLPPQHGHEAAVEGSDALRRVAVGAAQQLGAVGAERHSCGGRGDHVALAVDDLHGHQGHGLQLSLQREPQGPGRPRGAELRFVVRRARHEAARGVGHPPGGVGAAEVAAAA